jgi:thiaminase/transcriptional activator TenA
MSISDLVGRSQHWARATAHPFVKAVGDGTLPGAAFDTWLVQDHHFLADLLNFQARLLARAPRPAQPVLADGAVALVAELGWFEDVAAERELSLSEERAEATLTYARLLEELDAAPVPVALAGLWAIERVYLDAWSLADGRGSTYRPFVEHWTTPEFGAYVQALATATDVVAGPEDRPSCTRAVEAVLIAEVDFWETAWRMGR